MAFDNSAFTSWLLKNGKAHRTSILKKLKKDLQGRGMTPRQIYKGMLQLAGGTCILLARWRNEENAYLRDLRPSVISCVPSHNKSSSPRKAQCDAAHVVLSEEKILVDDKTVLNNSDEEDSSRKRLEKPITPELLGDKIDNASPCIVNVPRKAIPLNLKSYRAQSANKYLPPTRPSPEIRVADSSVSDGESTPQRLDETCVLQKSTRSDDDRGVKRPKIVADVTCIEGTIIPGLCLLKRPRISQNSKKDCDNFVDITETSYNLYNSPGICDKDSEKNWKSNLDEERQPRKHSRKKNRKFYDRQDVTARKLRLHEKCRQLFGSDLTLSELDEEKEIIERFVHTNGRKKHSRISQDSGVGLSDWASSDGVTISTEIDCPNRSEGNEKLNKSASLHDLSSNEKEEHIVDTTVPSMPPLNASHETISTEKPTEDLPDSSTNIEEKSVKTEVTMADSSNDGKVSSNGTIKILISPLYPESSDSFTPVSLELELSCETKMPAPTSTTEFPPVVKMAETINNQERANMIDIDVQTDSCSITVQENKISIREEEKTSNSSIEDVTKLPIICNPQSASAEIANFEVTSLTNDSDKCKEEAASHDPVIDSQRQEQAEPLNLCSRSHEIDSKDQTPKINADSEITIGPIDRTNNTENIVNNENNIGPPLVPKFRVLHPRELGSRWCPTPLNTDPTFVNIEKPTNSQLGMFPMPERPQVQLDPIQQATSIESLKLLTINTPIDTNNAVNIGKGVIMSSQNSNTNVHFPEGHRGNFVNSPGSVLTSSVLPTTIFNGNARQEEDVIFKILSKYLIPLNILVEKSILSYGDCDAVTLQRSYTAQRELLWLELGKFCSYIRTDNLEFVVNRIVAYYDVLIPPEKRLFTTARFMDILTNETLPTVQRPVAQRDSSPLQLPLYRTCAYLPQNSIPSYIPQRDIQSNLERPKLERFRPVQSIFTEVQKRIFSHQVRMYNYFEKILSQQVADNAVREKRKRRSRKKVVPAENKTGNTTRNVLCDETCRAAAPNNETILRLLNEPLQVNSVGKTTLRVHQETRLAESSVKVPTLQETLPNITTMDEPILKAQLETPKNPAMVNQLENIKTRAENCDNSNQNIERVSSMNNSTVDITDVLKELDALSSPHNDNNSINERTKSSSNCSCHESSSIPGGFSGFSDTIKTICSNSIGRKIGNDKTEDIPVSENTRMHTNNDYNVTMINKHEEKSANEKIYSREDIKTSEVDLIVLDDRDWSENLQSSQAAVIEEMKSISILEVKSISKDVFNNMNSDDIAAPLQTTIQEQKEEVSPTPMYEWSDCFRCGKTSSVVCERCYLAFYCSAECHEADWMENHHTNCKPVPVETLAQLKLPNV